MHRPVLVTPPADFVISIEEAMRQCRIDAPSLDEDALEQVQQLLGGYILAATDYLDGWEGTLGRCLRTQVWRQNFDRFGKCLRLPLGPASDIGSVTWRDDEGQVSTISAADYSLETDAGGRSFVRFRDRFTYPSPLYEVGAVSVTYTAGSNIVPAPIGQAICLAVGAWYENREETVVGVSVTSLPPSTMVSIERLITPYRRDLF